MTRVRMFTGATFASLRVRNFRLFFVGQGISQVGTWLNMIAQTLLVLRLTDSGVALGLLAAAQFGPVLLFGAWAGVLADRSDKRRLLIHVQTLSVVQGLAMAALATMSSPPLAAVYALAVASGVLTAFDNPARRSFVVEMVPDDQVTNAVSLNSALMTGARVVGPALAGLLVLTLGFAWTFVFGALSRLAVISGLARMRTEDLRPSPVLERAKGQIRAGLRYTAGAPVLWIPLVMVAVVGTLAFNFQVVFPLFVRDDLGQPESAFTLLYSVVSLGSFVGALAVARRSGTTVRFVAASAVAFGVAMALLAIAPNQGIAFVVGPLIGISSIAFMTSATAIVQMEAVPEMRGRVLALQAMVFLGSTPIGGPIVGWVAEEFGARWSIALGAAACLLAGLWGLLAVRRGAEGSGSERPAGTPSGVEGDGVGTGSPTRTPQMSGA